MHVSVCVHVCVHVSVCVLGQRLTLGAVFLNHSSSECSKAGPLTEPGIHQWAKAHQGARDQPVSTVTS